MNELEPLKLKARISPTFSYLEYHNDGIIKATRGDDVATEFSLLKEIKIENPTNNAYDNVILKISFDLPLFSFEDMHLGHILPGSEDSTKQGFRLHIDQKALYQQVGIEACEANLTLIEEDTGTVLASLVHHFSVLPINRINVSSAKSLLPYLIAKFIVSDHPQVNELVLKALSYHDNKPFIGYQNNNLTDIVEEINSLYKAVHDDKIFYSNPLASLDKGQWGIRLPQECLRDHRGTCIDTSILFAALMENIGLHPIVIINDTHAYVGVFLKEHDFFNYVNKSSSDVYNKTAKGIQSILVFETTLATSDKNASFQKAIETASETLRTYRGNTFYAIDVSTCHKSYFKPIPFANEDGVTDLEIQPLPIRDEKVEEILNQAFIDVERPQEKDRFTTWETKLLDLSKGNKLVCYNAKNSIRLAFHTGESFYNFLKKHDDSSFTMKLMSAEISAGLEASILGVQEKSEDLMKNENAIIGLGNERQVKKLIRDSQEALEETGAPTLYLTLGMLSYVGLEGKKEAPFLLLPITMAKEKFGNGYTISLDVDDLMVNQTFFEYYRVLSGGIDFSDFYGINVNDSYSDIVSTFKSKPGGELHLDENVATISNFTFAHYVMWKDVHDRKEDLRKNKVIQSLLNNKSIIENETDAEGEKEKSADERDNMALFAAPLSYDSTQLNAILSCGKGNSFILDGPPGTGKSQTIVNMIVNAMYQGKSVLFVAEKMAALSVVKDRLDELGLGTFALELYSNKANKSSVFSQLKKSIDFGRIKDSEEFQKNCDGIEKEKQKLIEEIEILHQKGNHRYSLYEALEIHTSHECYQNILVLSPEYVDQYDYDKDEKVRALLKDIQIQASSIKDFNHSVYPAFKMTKFAYFDTEKFLRMTTDLDMELATLYKDSEDLLDVLKIDESLTRHQYLTLKEILSLYLSNEVKRENLKRIEFYENHTRDSKVLADLCQLKEKDLSFKDYNLDKLIEIDIQSLIDLYQNATGFFKKFSAKGKIKKTISIALKEGKKVATKNLDSLLKEIQEYQSLYQSIKKQSETLNAFFGIDILENRGKSDEYLHSYEATYKTYHLLKELNLLTIDTYDTLRLFSDYTIDDIQKIRLVYNEFETNFSRYLQHEQDLQNAFSYDYQNVGNEDFFCESKEILDYVSDQDNADELPTLAKYNNDCLALKEEGLEELCKLLSSHKIDVQNLVPILESALAEAYIRLYFANDKVNSFTASDMEAAISHYIELIEKYNADVITSTVHKVTSRFIDNSIDYQDSSPIGALKKLVSKGGRGITIRNALIRYEEYFRTYFPCFMMSPLSAAQYLSVDSKKFDVVIFDEASQIPTSEAIGPIARGNALIVSGDPKQMPPTDFFNMTSMQDNDSNIDASLIDAESLLDDCLSIDMPRIRLSYHYRSKHESLISFSNKNFYDGSLYTFPSTDASRMKISFRHIVPKEEKKSSDITEEEINAILSEVEKAATDPLKKGKTIGVIVFNTKQQDKLKDAFEAYLDKNPEIRDDLYSRKMPPFIKSLENVQGDERDIIILSVGFRKKSDNTALIQGPITLDKGERRLNVAITRAKAEMIVISTIKSEEIVTENSKNMGPKYLKSFLRFAQGNSNSNITTSNNENEDAILLRIRSALKARGYESDISVGTSEFRIPLAVKKPDDDHYTLAVFIDQDPPTAQISQRDKHYVQRNMLCSLGWKTIDIYALDFFRYPKNTIDKIVFAFDAQKPTIEVAEKNEPILEQDNTRFDYQIKKYIEYRTVGLPISDISSLRSDVIYPNVMKELTFCIQMEQPLSYETLKARMKPFFNVSRYSAKVESLLRYHLEHSNFITTKEGDKEFYFNEGNFDHVVNYFRASDRHIEDIAKEEILVLMKRVLVAQGGMNREDFIHAVSKLMNIQVINETVRNKLEKAIDYGIGAGIIPIGSIL